MLDRYRVALIVLALIVSARVASAQPVPMRAELKNGLVLHAQVDEVTDWGFWIDGGRGLLFKQLDHVQTESRPLADQVLAAMPEARLEEAGDVYTVHFEHLTVLPSVPQARAEPRALEEFTVVAGPSVGSRLGLETTYNVRTRFTGPAVFQLGHTSGGGIPAAASPSARACACP